MLLILRSCTISMYQILTCIRGLGYIEVPSMGDVSFPPAKGFAVSTWIHIANFANSHDIDILPSFTFEYSLTLNTDLHSQFRLFQ